MANSDGIVSIIIPVYKEEGNIVENLRSLKSGRMELVADITVVDGEESGGTIARIEDPGVTKLLSPKGRALQMNRGAGAASGSILLFLHADTLLPENGLERIVETIGSGRFVAGAFNYAVNSRSLFIRHIYYTSYLRSRISRIAYGDQGIFIRKDYFERIGGFPEIPIMEDVELMKRIKKNKDKIRILDEGVLTSPRRYLEEGKIFGWLRNHRIRILYYLGVSPERLSRWYPDTREKQ